MNSYKIHNFKNLCNIIGIKTLYDLQRFAQENNQSKLTLIERLENYKKEIQF